MTFISLEFLFFFPAVVFLYFLLPQRYRWGLLLVASYYFYAAWRLEYTVLILASTVVDYFAGRQMARLPTRAERRPYLLLSLLVNLGLLFAFKYADFFGDSVRQAFAAFNIFYDVPVFDLLLPVGISFYTFQTLSYTIDVYRGKLAPEPHFGIFALYVSFFPQLVAGPIERASHLLPQLRQGKQFDQARVVSGLQLIMWGVLKKAVIADRLAIYVDSVYSAPDVYGGWPTLLATYFFAFQIYCDFSGYTDIAIGAARVMGFDLMQNFRQPYMARSVREFWQRWHISLSTWFRDYLYIPLGGNRVSIPRWYLNLFIVFVVSGLWHGANWTFVIWGGLHGLFVIGGILWEEGTQKLPISVRPPEWLAIVVTFHLVALGWIFFRAESLGDVAILVGNLGQNLAVGDLSLWLEQIYAPWGPVVADPSLEMGISVGLILLLLLIQWIDRREPKVATALDRSPVSLRWATYLAGGLIILNFSVANQVPFIYFQF